ncbi:hypothetical protein ACIP88_04920 [Streptomyces uncialis]|uniref:hypothetical protein n=1 Tax=Streptomyces uncialis TaxID=1048205 RepID=UPI0038089DD7
MPRFNETVNNSMEESVSATSTSQTCTHPVRDLTIVVLGSAVIGLGTAIVVMALGGNALAACGASGGAFLTSVVAGAQMLSHFKRGS